MIKATYNGITIEGNAEEVAKCIAEIRRKESVESAKLPRIKPPSIPFTTADEFAHKLRMVTTTI